MDDIDFDIDNYSNEELYQLIDVEENASENEIIIRTQNFIDTYTQKGQPQYVTFFTEVQTHLLSLFNSVRYDNAGGHFIQTEYQPNATTDVDLVNRTNYVSLVDNNRGVVRRQRLPINQGTQMSIVQGQMNPTLRNIKSQLINIDSHYREIIQCATTESADCSGTVCTGTNFTFTDSSTDFTFDLSQPIRNVIKMQLYTYEIPHSWYTFSSDYGTNTFGVSGECIDISAGNYDASGLIDAVNAAMVGVGVTAAYNSINQKTTFSSGGTNFTLTFYDPSGICPGSTCDLPGPKLDYNLGWLLGFRNASYSGASSYEGESLIDTYGFRYLFLVVDDFNQNRLNQGVISLTANRDFFTYPASMRCSLPAILDPSSGSCGKPKPGWRGPGLTRAQVYTRTQLLNSQNQGYPDRYLSAVNSDVLARIPVRKSNHYDLLIDNWNPSPGQTAREYFGPVTLKRFRVRLLNDKGLVVNLNQMNFSFSIIVKHLYQY